MQNKLKLLACWVLGHIILWSVVLVEKMGATITVTQGEQK